MKSHSLALIVLLNIVSYSNAQPAAKSARGAAVPKSVLDALGLKGLEVSPAKDDPADLPAARPMITRPEVVLPDATPADSARPTVTRPNVTRPDAIPASQRVAVTTASAVNTQLIESKRKAAAKAIVEAETANGKVDTAKKSFARAESEYTLAAQMVSQRLFDLKQTQQNLAEAQAAVDAAQQQEVNAKPQVAALSTAGTAMLQMVKTKNELMTQLGPIQRELKKVAEAFKEVKVAAALANLEEVLAENKTQIVADERKLADTEKEFKAAYQAYLVAHATTEKTLQALALLQRAVVEANQRLDSAQKVAEEKRQGLAQAELLVEKSAADLEAARELLRAAEVAVKQAASTPPPSQSPLSESQLSVGSEAGNIDPLKQPSSASPKPLPQ